LISSQFLSIAKKHKKSTVPYYTRTPDIGGTLSLVFRALETGIQHEGGKQDSKHISNGFKKARQSPHCVP
jgi:hypothetical protein